MGYIAPVAACQYEDYKRRIEQAVQTRDPMPVTPASKVKLRFERIMSFYCGGKYSDEKSKNIEELCEVTGKGRYVNEYV